MERKQKDAKEIKQQVERTIKNLRKTLNEQKKIIEDYSLTRKMLMHELKNPLNAIIGYPNLLKMEGLSWEKHNDYLSRITSAGEYMLGLIDLIQIGEITKKQIIKNSRTVNLEGIARESAKRQSSFLEEEKIRLNFLYNKLTRFNPITIYTNEGIIKAMWNTLIGNSLNYALPETQIKQAIKINSKNNLEILIENIHNGKNLRKVSGIGSGIGTMYTNKILNVLGGNFSNYNKSEINKQDYQYAENFGIKELKDEKQGEVWGVKIEIPMKELEEPDYKFK